MRYQLTRPHETNHLSSVQRQTFISAEGKNAIDAYTCFSSLSASSMAKWEQLLLEPELPTDF